MQPQRLVFDAARRVGLGLASLALFAGCSGDPAAPAKAKPVLRTEVLVIDNPASESDSTAHATCQTGALLSFRASNPDGSSYDPAGETLTYAWLFEVDRGEGIEPAPDLPPGFNPYVTQDLQLDLVLSTIGLHHVTLTARTRDGRSASTQLFVRVTACEDC
jgi:hypothetical protein